MLRSISEPMSAISISSQGSAERLENNSDQLIDSQKNDNSIGQMSARSKSGYAANLLVGKQKESFGPAVVSHLSAPQAAAASSARASRVAANNAVEYKSKSDSVNFSASARKLSGELSGGTLGVKATAPHATQLTENNNPRNSQSSAQHSAQRNTEKAVSFESNKNVESVINRIPERFGLQAQQGLTAANSRFNDYATEVKPLSQLNDLRAHNIGAEASISESELYGLAASGLESSGDVSGNASGNVLGVEASEASEPSLGKSIISFFQHLHTKIWGRAVGAYEQAAVAEPVRGSRLHIKV